MSSHANCQVHILPEESFADAQASHTHIVVQYNPQEFRFAKAQRHKFILLRRYLICHLGSAILKIQEITEITAKSRQNSNAYEMYKFVNFCNLTRKRERKYRLCQNN